MPLAGGRGDQKLASTENANIHRSHAPKPLWKRSITNFSSAETLNGDFCKPKFFILALPINPLGTNVFFNPLLGTAAIFLPKKLVLSCAAEKPVPWWNHLLMSNNGFVKCAQTPSYYTTGKGEKMYEEKELKVTSAGIVNSGTAQFKTITPLRVDWSSVFVFSFRHRQEYWKIRSESVPIVFCFVSCKTSQYVNISQLRTGNKFKVPKQPPLYS